VSDGRLLRVNDVDLCVETFGDERDPAILLISGAGSSMDWWPEEFCQRLADRGRFVIRYDHRDTGESVSYPAGSPGYTGADLAADAVGVLDALGLRSAHVVGISMGGALAQRIAVDHPDRVESLVLVSTSIALPGGPSSLPPMAAPLREYYASASLPDPSDRSAVVDYLVDYDRRLSGPSSFDEPRVRRLVERVVERSRDMAASLTNHGLLEDGAAPRGGIAKVEAPTLVVHGTADPLFPYGHAEALARELPDASLLPLPGVGHQMPPPAVWPTVIPAILRHTSGGWDVEADRLAARSLAHGDPTGWFDRLYAAGVAGEVPMPWSREEPHALLVPWAQERGLRGAGQRAVVVGCGLGADAEFVAGLGYDTVAFDISETALAEARRRYPDSRVRYTVGDLLDLPGEWEHAFDLVVDINTVQALPEPPRRTAITQVGRLVAPGGTLIVIAFRQAQPEAGVSGPPWPLTRDEIDLFTVAGLRPVSLDELVDVQGKPRWRAVFEREPG
jgi:pimeloyl-ACP methyl ester carboxylesterase/SAM-dependent methyltransferase